MTDDDGGGSGTLVVVAFSSHAMILGDGHSFPACGFFFKYFFNGDQREHTDSSFYARIGPEWLSELGRLWPNVP